MYGYCPNQIAAMTPAQQMMMLLSDNDDPSVDTLQFTSPEEHQNWLRRRNA